jgi:IMP cyclohydrolase
VKSQRIGDALSASAYPGRGIIMGLSAGGLTAVAAYFIMGRSAGSRNRAFIKTKSGICTRAFDEAILPDPSLYVYAPVLAMDNYLIVTNGDQTDTIAAHIKGNSSFEMALRARAYEPDSLRTPRISGLMDLNENNFNYKLSIIKSADDAGEACGRFFFEYAQPAAGAGHLLHTYGESNNEVISFQGEPVPVSVSGSIGIFTDNIWRALNEENRVSLYTQFVNLRTGEAEWRIVNKYDCT